MKQITTNQKTFGKATKKQIKELCPTALRISKLNKDFIIRDQDGNCVATWHKRRNENGLIVIH